MYKEGRNVLETTRPKEFDELVTLLHPRGEQVFFGAYDPDAAPRRSRGAVRPAHAAARLALPAGDFRDWPAIEALTAQIAAALKATQTCQH